MESDSRRIDRWRRCSTSLHTQSAHTVRWLAAFPVERPLVRRLCPFEESVRLFSTLFDDGVTSFRLGLARRFTPCLLYRHQWHRRDANTNKCPDLNNLSDIADASGLATRRWKALETAGFSSLRAVSLLRSLTDGVPRGFFSAP